MCIKPGRLGGNDALYDGDYNGKAVINPVSCPSGCNESYGNCKRHVTRALRGHWLSQEGSICLLLLHMDWEGYHTSHTGHLE